MTPGSTVYPTQRRDQIGASLFKLQNDAELIALERRVADLESKLEVVIKKLEEKTTENDTKTGSTSEKMQKFKEELDALAEIVKILCSDSQIKRKQLRIHIDHSLDLSHSKSFSKDNMLIQNIIKSSPITEKSRQVSKYIIIETPSKPIIEGTEPEQGGTTRDKGSSIFRSAEDITFLVGDDLFLIDKKGNYIMDDAGERVRISKDEYNRLTAE